MLRLLLACTLLVASCMSASQYQKYDPETDGVISYRLVEKSDFWSKTSHKLWGNIAHGAEISTHIVPADDYDQTGTFQAVMRRRYSYWNKIRTPALTAAYIAGLVLSSPVNVDPTSGHPEWYILQHEQIHFTIMEVAARQLSRSVIRLKEPRRPESIQRLHQATLERARDRHAEFDGDTSGKFDEKALERWVRVLERQMRGLCGRGPECQVRSQEE